MEDPPSPINPDSLREPGFDALPMNAMAASVRVFGAPSHHRSMLRQTSSAFEHRVECWDSVDSVVEPDSLPSSQSTATASTSAMPAVPKRKTRMKEKSRDVGPEKEDDSS
jgi:hypothetical protein